MAKQIRQTTDTRTQSTGSAWSPAQTPQGVKLTHKPNTPFYFWSHPQRWGVIDGEFLPILGKRHLDPGVGGVDKDGGMTRALVQLQEKGRTVIAHDACADKHDAETYCVQHTVKGGKLYLTPFETPTQIGSLPRMATDGDAYKEWLRALVAEGHVPQADPLLVAELASLERQRYERLLSQGRDRAAEKKLKKLEVIEAAQADLEGKAAKTAKAAK